MAKITIFDLPIETFSEANKRTKIVTKEVKLKNGTSLKIKKRKTENWREAGKRHKEQKWMVKKIYRDNKFNFSLPLEITLVRISSRKLDSHDNLPMSMKWVADSLAEEITHNMVPGRADDNKNITWKYDQRKGNVRENYVKVIIEEK